MTQGWQSGQASGRAIKNGQNGDQKKKKNSMPKRDPRMNKVRRKTA